MGGTGLGSSNPYGKRGSVLCSICCQNIFKAELGTMKGVVAKFVIDPQHYRNRARKLECLKSCGIISPVQFSDWATNSIHNQTSDTIYE